MDAAALALAQAIATLGATGILALILVLWLLGKLHSDKEVDDQKEITAERLKDWAAALAFRDQLRSEAIADRKEADKRVEALTATIKESNDLGRRTLDLNERLVEELTKRLGSDA